MPTQRLYQVARQLGLPSRVLMLYLQGLGRRVASASCHIDPELARDILAADLTEIEGRARAEKKRLGPRTRHDALWAYDDWLDDRTWVGPDPVTTTEAAAFADVSPATIRKWVERGHLHACARRGRSNLYRLMDVEQARNLTRTRNRQPRGIPADDSPFGLRRSSDRAQGTTSANIYDLVTAREAAVSASIAESTVRSWVRRGHLKAAGKRGRHSLFVRADVLRLARRPPYKPRRRGPAI